MPLSPCLENDHSGDTGTAIRDTCHPTRSIAMLMNGERTGSGGSRI